MTWVAVVSTASSTGVAGFAFGSIHGRQMEFNDRLARDRADAEARQKGVKRAYEYDPIPAPKVVPGHVEHEGYCTESCYARK